MELVYVIAALILVGVAVALIEMDQRIRTAIVVIAILAALFYLFRTFLPGLG